MSENKACECGSGPKLIFACSGAADVGAIADQAARTLMKEGAGKMFCLAGIGGRVPGIMEASKSAATILAIDGCPLNCVSACLKISGFDRFDHILVTDLGLEKGKSEVNASNVNTVVARGRELLAC